MNSTMDNPLNILLVEDDTFDEALTKKYLKKGLAHYILHVMHDGSEALDFLHRQGRYKKQDRPDLILLDMGLPKVNGDEVLKELKEDPELKNIPVVVLTGRQSPEEDPVKKFRLGENCYMNKWVNMGDFLAIVKAAEDVRSAPADAQ